MIVKQILNARTSRRLLPAFIIAAVMIIGAVAFLAPDTETDAALTNVQYVKFDYENYTVDSATGEDLQAAADFGGAAGNYTLTGAYGAEWFIVTQNIDLGNSTLTILGTTVNLVIGADCTLKVDKGIIVGSNVYFNLYTEDPTSAGGTDFGVLKTVNNGVTVNHESFENTAHIDAGENGIHYTGGSWAIIYNGVSGIIEGGINGISIDDADIYNYGYIAGTNHGVYSPYYFIIQCNFGSITGNVDGIHSGGDGYLHNNYGLIIGDSNGVYFEYGGEVQNFETGEIYGNNNDGIHSEDGTLSVSNYGLIDGDLNGIYAARSCEVWNDAAGASITGGNNGIYCGYGEIGNIGGIYGDSLYGIYLDSGGEVYNDGTIMGITGGIEANDDTHIENYDNGSIVALGGGEWAIRLNSGDLRLINYGLVNGPGGIQTSGLRGGWEIRNAGAIEGIAGDAIVVTGGDLLEIYNDGGRIWGSNNGIILYAQGNIFNYQTMTDTGTILASSGNGIYLMAGGMVYNEGEIAGITADSTIDLKQWGLISGSVVLSNLSNNVLLGSESVIEGNFNMGTDPGSTLSFEGTPTGVPYKYARVGGIADIGVALVSLKDLPAGFSTGKIVLIDANTGAVTGTPGNATYTTGAPDPVLKFNITAEPLQLIAEVVVSGHVHYITASADSNSTITPSGKVTVANKANVTFTFSAAAGYFVGAVVVDGVYQPQSVIDAGEYTFNDVLANHTISVISRTPTSGITLKINIVEGKGYAEYSVNGGQYTKYTSPVALIEGANVSVRAVADKGYEFAEWREGSNVIQLNEVSYTHRSTTLELNLSFISDGSSGGALSGSNLWLMIVVMIVVLLVLFLLFFLFRKKSKDGATKG